MRLCRLAVTLSIHRRWSRQCYPIENFADKKVSLNVGPVFADDLIVKSQTKQTSRVPGVSNSMTIRSTDTLSLRLMLTILPHAHGGEAVRPPTDLLYSKSSSTCTQGSKALTRPAPITTIISKTRVSARLRPSIARRDGAGKPSVVRPRSANKRCLWRRSPATGHSSGGD